MMRINNSHELNYFHFQRFQTALRTFERVRNGTVHRERDTGGRR